MTLHSIAEVRDQIKRFNYGWAKLLDAASGNPIATMYHEGSQAADKLEAELIDYLQAYPGRYTLQFRKQATGNYPNYEFLYAPSAELQGPSQAVDIAAIRQQVMQEVNAKMEAQEREREVQELRDQLAEKNQLQGVINGALEHIATKLMTNPALANILGGSKEANLQGVDNAEGLLSALSDSEYNTAIEATGTLIEAGLTPVQLLHVAQYLNANRGQIEMILNLTNYEQNAK